ncbi:hypothetical protein [Catellatospora chokoriensis]|uniref:Uncharacterized protein n=1 Tax=Catellatospora chokoriensis TaxID=310353 RepID=A0A8J3JPP3_9ACTN|nr:hypothetical protein [Catellatospora chokoriensis]GIF88787.1 hypothetical protein Cch02nite_22310 [Catellatospora chokoriensis]
MKTRRLLAGAVSLTAAAAVALLGGQAPAAAYEDASISASAWAYTRSDQARTSFVNQAVNAPVGRQEPATGEKYRSRFYFTFDLAGFDGRKVTQATLFAQEKTVTDCGAQAPLELWRTAPIGSSPTWRNPPAELEKLGTPARNEGTGCPGYLKFDLLATVLAAKARGEAKLTLELRVAEGSEGGLRFGRTFFYRPGLQFTANTVPTIGNQRLYFKNECGTQSAPTIVAGSSAGVMLAATVTDPDHDDETAEFAAWPVDQPEQRRTYPGGSYGVGDIRRYIPTDVYPHGTVVAWSARADDRHDQSEWAAPCYFAVDSVAPAHAPLISSQMYPESNGEPPTTGGVGIPGTFTLDAQGDQDVVRYFFRDASGRSQMVDAPAPGAAVSITYTPGRVGQNTVYAAGVDRAGNQGPEKSYFFLARDTRPQVTLEMNGVNVPSRLVLSSIVAGITSYRYSVDGGPEVTVQAGADGSATADVVFTEVGYRQIAVSSYTADGKAGVWSGQVRVHDQPNVTSTGYDGAYHVGQVGTPLTWTFRPRGANVVAYEYLFEWESELHQVEAGPDGVAVLDLTPTSSGVYLLLVRSVYADGSVSELTDDTYLLID